MMAEGQHFQIVGNDISDGYHTFNELYEHRFELFIALCRLALPDYYVWRSRQHHDGSMFEGWFILGINTQPGKQITYHLPLSRWDDILGIETLDRAPEWDGHTAEDVLKRLRTL